MRWSANIHIDQADDRNAGGLKPKDVRREIALSPPSTRAASPCAVRELGQHDRGPFIDEIAPRHAEDRVVTLPFRRQGCFAENGQIFIRLHFQRRSPPQRLLPRRWLS